MKIDNIENIKKLIISDPMNKEYTSQGIEPLFNVTPESSILIIGQAPGIKAAQSKMTWNDKSGERLIEWLGVTKEQFYNPRIFGQMPMDFYYPGKGKTGDFPPRKGFAQRWHPIILDTLNNLKLIILIGSYSQDYYLSDSRNLTQRVRNFKDYLPKFFVLPHPSPLNFHWRNQNKWFIEEVLPELRIVVSQIINK